MITKSNPEGHRALLLGNWDSWLGLHGDSIKCFRFYERHPRLLPNLPIEHGVGNSPLGSSLFARSEETHADPFILPLRCFVTVAGKAWDVDSCEFLHVLFPGIVACSSRSRPFSDSDD